MNLSHGALSGMAMAVMAIAAAGCSQSCEKDKPYVPYSIDPSARGTNSASAVDALDPPTPEPPMKSFEKVEAKRLAPPGSTATSRAGKVDASRDQRIELLLDADLDADGKPDAVAWLRSSDGSTGELTQFAPAREGGPLEPRTLTTLPADMTVGAGCEGSTVLRQVGPRTIEVGLRRTCTTLGGGKQVVEWKAVVIPVRDPAVRLSLLIEQPGSGDGVEVDLDGLDRDGDQFDDLVATFSLQGETAASVAMHYFDRPAGLSRDPHEPAASFRSIGSQLARTARGDSTRGKVPATARAARRLYRALCAESRRPLVRVGGTPIQCGASEGVQRIAAAELAAALADKQWLVAVGVFDRATTTATGDKDDLQKKLEAAAPPREVDTYHLPFGPQVVAGPSWGGLAFEADGALLIRTDQSVMRFDPKTRVALPERADGPIAPWDRALTGPNGEGRVERVYDPCDGGLLRAVVQSGANRAEVALPADSATSDGCGANGRDVAVTPLAWTGAGPSLFVEQVPVTIAKDLSNATMGRPATGAGHRGGPMSPDGKTLVFANRLGLLVVGDDGKPQLWRSPAMAAGYERQSGCAVANGGGAVACSDGKRTRVFVPSPAR